MLLYSLSALRREGKLTSNRRPCIHAMCNSLLYPCTHEGLVYMNLASKALKAYHGHILKTLRTIKIKSKLSLVVKGNC